MPTFSYKKASERTLLNAKEFQRLSCLFLVLHDQLKPSGKDFTQAAAEFGGTKGSFEFAYRQIMRKLREGNAYIDGGEAESGSKAQAKSFGNEEKTATRKRKVVGEEGGEEGEGLVRREMVGRFKREKKEGSVKTEMVQEELEKEEVPLSE